MKKIRVGVLGAYRGTSMINYCKIADNAEVVAICDKWKEGLERQKSACEGYDITFYDNFDDFINHDMDAVVLANYANEHAPFAIRCMKKGLHVFSEVLPVQTMKEAVELVEAVEETGMIYAYGENYCFMNAPYEMKRLYQSGKLGELMYAECEYLHNCRSIWPSITYGEKDHWRNKMYSTYYCTHSLGPIFHAVKLRPVSVVGLELAPTNLDLGSRGGDVGIEMVTMENGGIVRSSHGTGGLTQNSIWYNLYGSEGHAESSRECVNEGSFNKITVKIGNESKTYYPLVADDDKVNVFGHGGSDFWSMYYFIQKILGDETADTIDVYEALDMGLCGMFAYRSILQGGVTVEIPNLRDKSIRDLWRNDTMCTDEKIAGNQLIPCHSKITPEIPDEVYAHARSLWMKEFEENTGYTADAFNQGSGKR